MGHARRWMTGAVASLAVCGALAMAGCGPSQVQINTSTIPVGHAVRLSANLTAPDGKTPVKFIIVAHDASGWHAFSSWDPACYGGLQVQAGMRGDFIKDPCLGTDWDLAGKLIAGPKRPDLMTLPVEVEGSEAVVQTSR